MVIKIIDKQHHTKGTIYTVTVQEKTTKILFLFHSLERIKKWGLTEGMVIETLLLPEEVIIGHRNRYIAHKIYDNHLVRAVYEYEDGLPVLLTVYFPYVNRYFNGGGVYEDKILK